MLGPVVESENPASRMRLNDVVIDLRRLVAIEVCLAGTLYWEYVDRQLDCDTSLNHLVLVCNRSGLPQRRM